MSDPLPASRSPHWPAGLPWHLPVPPGHLYEAVTHSARRFPDKPYLVFCDTPLTFAQFHRDTLALAGWMQQAANVQRGDRVLLYLQNSPQFALAYYAVLRCDAVVVPVNPMNRAKELAHCVSDTGARLVIAAQDLLCEVQGLLATGRASGQGLQHALVVAYSDALREPTPLNVPAFVLAPRQTLAMEGATAWVDALAAGQTPGPMRAGPDDLAVMPYTSGTTGQPKGCMHTHRSVAYNTVARGRWLAQTHESVQLAALPFFHVTGMQNAMNGSLQLGATAVVLPRWDRDVALACIERHRITGAQLISPMVIDLLSHPDIDRFDLSSLQSIGGGGAAMPEAVAQRLKALTGLDYIEGYGMSETMAATHINPVQRPLRQCLGIPIFEVDSRVIDPVSLAQLPAGEVGEIVVRGPQVMQGYWRNEAATREAFVTLDGQRFLRTGDLARVDEGGYFHMVDRLKRMINASGFKVWPAEVEALLHAHPAIQEACVVGVPDRRRGETVRAVIVLRPGFEGQVTPQDITAWAHAHMAAYKCPRIVDFVAQLPKSATGKVQWRALQGG